MKLLIADDHEPIRSLLRSMFAGDGVTIFEATCGVDAVNTYAVERPDWVFMDLRMEPLGGLQATRLIKRRFPEARIIILTHCAEAELRAAAVQAGAYDFILKENLTSLPAAISYGKKSLNPERL